MLERVCRQLGQQGLGNTALFVTHQDQAGLTRRYTKDCYPIIAETHKRGTFTAIALAAVYLHSIKKVNPNEIICAAPADMYADDDFFRLFNQLPSILNKSQASIALLGTRPAYPSDQYGYILPENSVSSNYSSVIRFEEKPDTTRAAELIYNHALWNCGVFGFSLGYMLSYLKQMGLPTDYNEFSALYPTLPVRSFDKEVVEKNQHTIVLKHEGTWRDLGSWESLTELLPTKVIGKGGISGESEHTHLINELNVPLYVINVPDIVAIASADGILVADKKQAHRIKEIVGLDAVGASNHIKYVETAWGSYCVLDKHVSERRTVETLKYSLLPNHIVNEIYSKPCKKIWTIVSGYGDVMMNDSVYKAQVGEVFTISKDDKHSIKAHSAMEWIELRITEVVK